jgi:hypothetical protein
LWADVRSAVNMLVLTSILSEKGFSMRHFAFARAATVAVSSAQRQLQLKWPLLLKLPLK